MNTTTEETAECWQCQTTFKWTRADCFTPTPSFCSPCTADAIAANVSKARQAAEAAMLKLTPARYQTTDTAHPDFNLCLWEEIQSWRPTDSFPWLGMIGPTGGSKTRCAFLLFREIVLGKIRPSRNPDAIPPIPSIAVVTAYQFAETVAAQFADARQATAKESLSRLSKADVLLFDDLGKQRNTPAVADALFALFDHRHAANLPTIWTANTPPERIVEGMNADLTAPLAGRIRECSHIINLF
mgnify:CR=1 FL=1